MLKSSFGFDCVAESRFFWFSWIFLSIFFSGERASSVSCMLEADLFFITGRLLAALLENIKLIKE